MWVGIWFIFVKELIDVSFFLILFNFIEERIFFLIYSLNIFLVVFKKRLCIGLMI